jgi:hypothetical protein
MLRCEPRHFAQHFQVDLGALPHARSLDLHRDVGPVMQHRTVYLRHGRCGQRLQVE